MSRFAFILGHVPVLSSIEAKKMLSDLVIEAVSDGVLVGASNNLDPVAVMERSGGIVKIAKFALSVSQDQAAEECSGVLVKLIPEGKITFGISSYGNTEYSDATAMQIKNSLKEQGRSVRHVRGKELILNGAELLFNEFHKTNHAELCFIPSPNKEHLIDVFVTEAFQDVRSFVALEELLNARDDRSGVLPLRLAKMLVNISGASLSDTLLDPFCGSGILVSVAATLGSRTIIASDSTPKAVADTQNNLKNVIARQSLNLINRRVEQWDARTLSKQLPSESIDSIITEPYLGPQTRVANDAELGQMKTLYHEAFKEFRKIMKPGGTVLFIFPVINSVQDFDEVQKSIRGMGFQKIDLMDGIHEWFPDEIEPVYSRPRQRVKRLITLWKRV